MNAIFSGNRYRLLMRRGHTALAQASANNTVPLRNRHQENSAMNAIFSGQRCESSGETSSCKLRNIVFKKSLFPSATVCFCYLRNSTVSFASAGSHKSSSCFAIH